MSDASLSSLSAWLQWVSICGTALGLLSAIGLLFVRTEITRRQEHKLNEAHQRISDLQPKSLKVRVITYLQRLDPRIMEAAQSGQRTFSGTFTTAQLAELQSLCSEDPRGTYISIVPTTSIIIPGPGQHGDIRFSITDALLQ